MGAGATGGGKGKQPANDSGQHARTCDFHLFCVMGLLAPVLNKRRLDNAASRLAKSLSMHIHRVARKRTRLSRSLRQTLEGLLAICPSWPQDSVHTIGACLLLSSIMPRGETFCMQDCRFASSTKHRTRATKNTFCRKWTFWTSGPEKRPLPP